MIGPAAEAKISEKSTSRGESEAALVEFECRWPNDQVLQANILHARYIFARPTLPSASFVKSLPSLTSRPSCSPSAGHPRKKSKQTTIAKHMRGCGPGRQTKTRETGGMVDRSERNRMAAKNGATERT